MNELSPKPGESATLSDRGAPAAAPARRRRLAAFWVRLLLFALVLGGLAALAAVWGRSAVLYVHETDARIKADLIAVASEVAGRVTARPVQDGDRVTRGHKSSKR